MATGDDMRPHARRTAKPVEASSRRIPAPADYYDEVSREQLERIRELVREDVGEDLEVVDGPAW